MKLKPYNTPVTQCSACGDKCWRFSDGWWCILGFVLWIVFFDTALGWTTQLSLGWTLLIGVPINFAWWEAADRLYHHYWLWKHPARCGGGGEPEPQPSLN